MINLIKGLLKGENRTRNLTNNTPEDLSKLSGHVVVSLPPEIRNEFKNRLPSAITTYDAFSQLFREANQIIKIFSPYVDPTFTGFVQSIKCPVEIVTTLDTKKGFKGNSCLERCASDKDVLVRYIVQRKSKMQIFQIHAKLILIDKKIAYVGSANLTDTSIHYNLELGLVVDEPRLLTDLDRMFDFFFENVAVPTELL